MRINKLLAAATILDWISNGVYGGYAPICASCPPTALVRPANGLSLSESTYRQQRKENADQALAKWLAKISRDFETHDCLPTVRIRDAI
jgi:hypothetical protein